MESYRNKKVKIDEIVKIIKMYFNNQDWKGYLKSLTDEDEVKEGIREVLEGVRGERSH